MTQTQTQQHTWTDDVGGHSHAYGLLAPPIKSGAGGYRHAQYYSPRLDRFDMSNPPPPPPPMQPKRIPVSADGMARMQGAFKRCQDGIDNSPAPSHSDSAKHCTLLPSPEIVSDAEFYAQRSSQDLLVPPLRPYSQRTAVQIPSDKTPGLLAGTFNTPLGKPDFAAFEFDPQSVLQSGVPTPPMQSPTPDKLNFGPQTSPRPTPSQLIGKLHLEPSPAIGFRSPHPPSPPTTPVTPNDNDAAKLGDSWPSAACFYYTA